MLFLSVLGSAHNVQSAEFSYVLTGAISVLAPTNAAKYLILDLASPLNIDSEGKISGEGTLTYLFVAPCQWDAPVPDQAGRDCRIDSVKDGTFSISGHVVETLRRRGATDSLETAILAYADRHSSIRSDDVPYRLAVTLTLNERPLESLTFWGLKNGRTQVRESGAAALGAHVSGLFDKEFELVAVNVESDVPVPGDRHIFDSSGTLNQGNMSVRGSARLALTALSRSDLPVRTSSSVLFSSWVQDQKTSQTLTPSERVQLAQFERSGERTRLQRATQPIWQSLKSLSSVRSIPKIIDYVFMDLSRAYFGLPALMLPQNAPIVN